MRSPHFSWVIFLLFMSACGRTTQDVSVTLQDATPFVPSNAQSGWTADLVTSSLHCQGTTGAVNPFCSCLIKAVTVALAPNEVAQAAIDARNGSSTAAVQQLTNLTQTCLSQSEVADTALVATNINRAYQFRDTGCTTDAHTFTSDSLFCIHLQRESRNNRCALAQRQQTFADFCQGTFQSTP